MNDINRGHDDDKILKKLYSNASYSTTNNKDISYNIKLITMDDIAKYCYLSNE